MPVTEQQLIDEFSRAIAEREGFNVKRAVPTIPQRMNNPGDLRRWKDAKGQPYPEVNGYVDFPACEKDGCKDPDHPCEVGWRALRAQCKINILKRGLTFLEFFAGKPNVYEGFAPSRDKNNPVSYAQFVCDRVNRKLGTAASLDTRVSSLVQGVTSA